MTLRYIIGVHGGNASFIEHKRSCGDQICIRDIQHDLIRTRLIITKLDDETYGDVMRLAIKLCGFLNEENNR